VAVRWYWIALTVILSGLAPGGKEFVESNKDAGLPADVESIIADRQLDKHFPQDGGMPVFAVGLILILLLVIYRSPLLTSIPRFWPKKIS
jgi:uncharacterized membrane protein YdfJ with MMPL/SSD domain